MLKYSLLHLLTVLLLAGVAAAALTRASSTWECLVLTATLIALSASVVAAVFRRPFAVGFAVFGWVYLLLLYAPWFSDLRPKLLTTWSVDWLYGKVQRPLAQRNVPPASQRELEWLAYQNRLAARGYLYLKKSATAPADTSNTASALQALGLASANPPAASEPPYPAFTSIGQAIWLWMIAYLGGWCACVVQALSIRAAATGSRSREENLKADSQN
ncbi:MAG: hypothetical protein HYS13_25925 [Planctomycetia bacterium]|nr:hypothetical protein [Planctomycetia bacterium]